MAPPIVAVLSNSCSRTTSTTERHRVPCGHLHLRCCYHRPGTIIDVKCLQDGRDVQLDGSLGQLQSAGNLLVRVSLHQQGQNIVLPEGQNDCGVFLVRLTDRNYFVIKGHVLAPYYFRRYFPRNVGCNWFWEEIRLPIRELIGEKMLADSRTDVRYWCSQKAVLVIERSSGSFGVITNLSSGGVCVAVVGSPRPWKQERIGLKLNRATFTCDIVNSGKEGLHCRFENPIGGPDLSNILPFAPRLQDKTSASMPGIGSYALGLVYREGCFAARDQIDPSLDDLDATVNVLNPYQIAEKRDRWAMGLTMRFAIWSNATVALMSRHEERNRHASRRHTSRRCSLLHQASWWRERRLARIRNPLPSTL